MVFGVRYPFLIKHSQYLYNIYNIANLDGSANIIKFKFTWKYKCPIQYNALFVYFSQGS